MSTPIAITKSSGPAPTSTSLPNGKDLTSLTSPQASLSEPNWSSPLTPTTFVSVLPILDELLGTLSGLATREESLDGVEAGKAVVGSARELFTSLEQMKNAALDLPGGDLSIERIKDLTDMLRGEADKRRTLLRQLDEVEMPIADGIQRSSANAAGDELVDGEKKGTIGAQSAQG